MKLLGCLRNGGKEFDFCLNQNHENFFTKNEVYTFSDSKIFVHIDGAISKLSNEANTISSYYSSITEKIAYLHSIDFKVESHICGSFNIFFFNFKKKELKIIRDTRGTRSLYYAKNGEDFIFASDGRSFVIGIKS